MLKKVFVSTLPLYMVFAFSSKVSAQEQRVYSFPQERAQDLDAEIHEDIYNLTQGSVCQIDTIGKRLTVTGPLYSIDDPVADCIVSVQEITFKNGAALRTSYMRALEIVPGQGNDIYRTSNPEYSTSPMLIGGKVPMTEQQAFSVSLNQAKRECDLLLYQASPKRL